MPRRGKRRITCDPAKGAKTITNRKLCEIRTLKGPVEEESLRELRKGGAGVVVVVVVVVVIVVVIVIVVVERKISGKTIEGVE